MKNYFNKKVGKRAALLFAGLVFMFSQANGQSPMLASADPIPVSGGNNGGEKGKKDAAEPAVIKHGNSFEAMGHSDDNKRVTVYLSGGKKDQYTPGQYAVMLQNFFKDPDRTGGFPTEISVMVDPSDPTNDHASAFVYINGVKYDKNGKPYVDGDGVLHPNEIVSHMPKIAGQHATKNKYAMLQLNSDGGYTLVRVADNNNLNGFD